MQKKSKVKKDKPLVKAALKEKRPPGRPPWIPSMEDIENIKKWRMIGLGHQHIADLLGVSIDTIYERKKEYPEFSEAFATGRARGVMAVAAKAFNNATTLNDFAAQRYYLETKGNWKSPAQTIEVTGKNGGPVEVVDKTKEILEKFDTALAAVVSRIDKKKELEPK